MLKKRFANFLRKLADRLEKRTFRHSRRVLRHSPFIVFAVAMVTAAIPFFYNPVAIGILDAALVAAFIIYMSRISLRHVEVYIVSLITVLLLLSIIAFRKFDVSFYIIPVSGLSAVCGILVGQYFSGVYATIFSIYISTFSSFDFFVFLFHFISSVLSILIVSAPPHTRAKTAMTGFLSFLTAVVLYPVIYTVKKEHDFILLIYMFLNGVVASLASILTVFFERFFNVITDMRLLELMDTTKGILSRLAFEAPGTYHHSYEVSKISGEVAKAIGADVLLAKCGGLYHDIGKILKPEVFIENINGTSIHENLNPSLSALAIQSHVKDGEVLAREEGLPEEIVSFITSHHGTTKVEYFYAMADKSAEVVYTYPGPKPKTVEEAIVMLADGIEAAIRSLAQKTEENIKDTVEKIIKKRIDEEQFVEVPLKLSDIEKLKKEFTRVMLEHYHSRIEYP